MTSSRALPTLGALALAMAFACAPAMAAKSSHAEASASCSKALASRLDALSAEAKAMNSQWDSYQRRAFEDAIDTARRTPWAKLDSDEAGSERQAASIRSADERERASLYAAQSRAARKDLTGKNASRAASAAEAERAKWAMQAKADSSAHFYASCVAHPPKDAPSEPLASR